MKHLHGMTTLLILMFIVTACNFPGLPTPEVPTATEEITQPPVVETTESIETEPPITETTEVVETEAPTEEVTQPPYTCPPDFIQASAFTAEFCYPASAAIGYNAIIIPEEPFSTDLPFWAIHPEMIEISLMGYPVIGQYQQPQVFIYPIADYIALAPEIATITTNLETLLTDQPADPPSIPFLPVYNAAQMMQAQTTYLNFRNGSGVRFITQYGQAALPINNLSAIYAFVGLTDDGQYVISATFPVTHPLFADDDMTEPPEGWAAFSNNYETYTATMEADLALQSPASFTPDLSILDEMMSSFLVPVDVIP
jgi:hypothetical protein